MSTGPSKVFICTTDGTIRTFKEVAGGSVPVKDKDFTYSGNCEVIDDSTEMGVNWRIKFLTSGVLTFNNDQLVDIFAVGGGSSGCTGWSTGSSDSTLMAGGGGGGGYTKTTKNITIQGQYGYSISIGAGGIGETVQRRGVVPGGNSTTPDITATGGTYQVDNSNNWKMTYGGNGGSGGGGGSYTTYQNAGISTGQGGTNGSNGTAANVKEGYTITPGAGGKGQGTTTREFGDLGATLYASGGNGGLPKYPSNGAANTGNGGEGGFGKTTYVAAGNGGSGIVIIRKHKD